MGKAREAAPGWKVFSAQWVQQRDMPMAVGDIHIWGPTWPGLYNTYRMKFGKGARNSILVVGKIKANAKKVRREELYGGRCWANYPCWRGGFKYGRQQRGNRRVAWDHATHDHGWLAVEVRTYYEGLVNLYPQQFWGLSLCKKQTVLVLVCFSSALTPSLSFFIWNL